MHPDMVHEMIRQRTAERQEEARKGSLARSVRKALRQRRRHEVPDTFDLPPIPDYVDGTFRTPEGAERSVPAGHPGTAR